MKTIKWNGVVKVSNILITSRLLSTIIQKKIQGVIEKFLLLFVGNTQNKSS